jgi:hypothetical protein
MRESFREYVEALHPSFECLYSMEPVKINALPKGAPSQCIYLFSEGSRHLYVGRTRHLRQRLRQHSIPASQHNQAVFAFRLAREATGNVERIRNNLDTVDVHCADHIPHIHKRAETGLKFHAIIGALVESHGENLFVKAIPRLGKFSKTGNSPAAAWII